MTSSDFKKYLFAIEDGDWNRKHRDDTDGIGQRRQVV
jgi:hypothetical protein